MRDNTIRKGDLVAVVRPTPCCGNSESVGMVYLVTGVTTGEAVCFHCHSLNCAPVAFNGQIEDGYALAHPIACLQKIHGDPKRLSVPEYVPQETVLG